MGNTKGKKNTEQTEDTKRKPLFQIVVGAALLLLAVVLLIRGINGLRFSGFSLNVAISFLGTILFAAVSGLLLSDLICMLKARIQKKS